MTRAHPDTPVPRPEDAAAGASAPPSGAYQGDLAEGLAPPDSLSAAQEARSESVQPPPVPQAREEQTAPSPPEAEPEAIPPTDPRTEPSSEAAPAASESTETASAPAETSTSASNASPGIASGAPPSTKELHAWLVKHRRHTSKAHDQAQAWVDEVSSSRKGRRSA